MRNKYIKLFTIGFLIMTIFTMNKIKMNAETNISLTGIETKAEGKLASDTIYNSFTASISNESNQTTKQNISYVKSNLENARVVTNCILNKNGIVASTVLEIAKDYELKHQGYEVIAAINGGYFFTGSRYETVNASVIEGNVIKTANHTKYFSLGFKSDGSSFVTSKINSTSSKYYLTIYDSSTLAPIKEIQLSGENITPSTNQTTFFDGSLISPAIANVSYFEVDAINNFKYDSTYIYGNVIQNVVSVSKNVVIATTEEEIVKLLEQNPVIRIERQLTKELKGYENVIGPGSQPLLNDIIQSPADMGDQNEAFCKGRDPRSSIGFDKDGNVIICAIDGRQTNMAGVSLTEEAYIMKSLGCNNAFNLDGGGSTELVIKENGSFKMLNHPCEEPYRKVTDAILIVVPKVKVNITEPVISSTSIKFDYSVEPSTLNPKIKIFANGEEINTTTNVNITNLDSNTSNFVNVVAEYEENGEVINTIIRTFKINETKDSSPTELVEPSNFNVTFKKNSSGFEAILTCDDPSLILSKVYLVDQYGNKQILIKSGSSYHTIYQESKNISYTFSILYYYKVNPVKIESKTYDKIFSYNYVIEDASNNSANHPKKGCNKNICLFVTPLLLIAGLYVFYKNKKH